MSRRSIKKTRMLFAVISRIAGKEKEKSKYKQNREIQKEKKKNLQKKRENRACGR